MTASEPDLYCGMFTDCPAFRDFIEHWFQVSKTKEEDRWWVRDWLSAAWNAGVDAGRGVSLTQEERRERAERIDARYIERSEP